MSAVIEVQDVSKRFGRLVAVEGISFDVQEGHIVGFLGPNGAGKTTTLRILTGYMPADSGVARVAGFDTFSQSAEVRRRVGYLPENTPLYPEMRVREYLRFRAQLKQVARAHIADRIGEVSEKCWLGDFIDRPIGQLSKGMRQRVGLADALISDPQVMFLDEPTIGLDPTQIRETRQLISELGERHTIMLSSHILSDVEAVCNQVIIIDRGRIAVTGSPEELSAQVAARSGLIVEVKGPPGEVVAALQALGSVERLAQTPSDGWQRLRLEPRPGRDVREEVVHLVIERGWALREVRREVASLEDYFVNLLADQASQPPDHQEVHT